MEAKTMLVQHFDKLALGLGGLLLAGTVLSGLLGQTTAEEQSALVDKYNRDIATKIDTAEKEIRRRRESEPPPSFFREAERELIGGPAPSALGEWLFHKRPKVATRVVGTEVPEPHHSAPIDFAGSPGLGRISLSWAEGRNEFVDPLGYTIYRRDREDGPWEKIGEATPKDTTYVDKDAQPRKQYWYYVESRAEATKRRLAGNVQIELPADQAVQKTIEIGPFTTRRDVYVKVENVQAETIEDRIKGIKVEEKAWLKVYRYLADDDQWKVSKLLTVKPGQTIGEVEKFGAKTTDFTTDYELVDVEIRDIERVLPGGAVTKVRAQIAVLRDKKDKKPNGTYGTFEINDKALDPGLEAVLQDLEKGRGAGSGSSGSGGGSDPAKEESDKD